MDINEIVTLSGGYSAARLAGMVSRYAPGQNVLNKNFSANALEYEFGRSTSVRAINKQFTVLSKFAGNNKVRRALTSAPAGDAFAQISTMVAVDDIRYAVRLTLANYIGKKNNGRIRQIMGNKVASVMSGYVSREIVQPGYQVTVTATRQQEIDGAVEVVLVFAVIFYIEFITVKLLLE